MHPFLLSLAVFSLIPNITFSQTDYVFKVILKDGEVSVNTNNGVSKPVTIGLLIGETDQLVLEEAAWCGLIHKSGELLELSQKGKYDIRDLIKNIKEQPSADSEKYAELLINNLGKGNKLKSNERQENYEMVSSAADSLPHEQEMRVLLPSSVEVLDRRIQLWWNSFSKSKSFNINIKNEFDEILLTQTSTDSTIVLNLDTPKLKNEKLWIIDVAPIDSEESSPDEYAIKVRDDSNGIVSKELDDLKKAVKPNSILGHLILAAFFEYHNLWPEALMNYKYALEASKGRERIKAVYFDFIERSGF